MIENTIKDICEMIRTLNNELYTQSKMIVLLRDEILKIKQKVGLK